MESLIFYLSPVAGFVFMLTMIMFLTRLAAGRKSDRKITMILVSSSTVMLAMIVYVMGK
ncbi:hypothetical protein QRD89_04230 [Halobacillus sp. ACCC02827]|uniref:hypothetical protein n=1 Tax=Halobacillus sp. ACCC02827 TaxID=3052090 RepID=UPI0025712945|nr:hypothetical protein [Halobacillus sp. ACCC02827]WJE16574.1 hypothetical protein QRD89_04230 [Halobacillus sp. ACCC02827]